MEDLPAALMGFFLKYAGLIPPIRFFIVPIIVSSCVTTTTAPTWLSTESTEAAKAEQRPLRNKARRQTS